jgi:hypothetical protein
MHFGCLAFKYETQSNGKSKHHQGVSTGGFKIQIGGKGGGSSDSPSPTLVELSILDTHPLESIDALEDPMAIVILLLSDLENPKTSDLGKSTLLWMHRFLIVLVILSQISTYFPQTIHSERERGTGLRSLMKGFLGGEVVAVGSILSCFKHPQC